MAPADVPEIPSIRSQGSSNRRSSTPHVNAPCEPPPCSARSTRMGSRSNVIARSLPQSHVTLERFGRANLPSVASRFIRRGLGGARRKAHDGGDDVADARGRNLIVGLV